MITIHHITVACPVCGETQLVALAKNGEVKTTCDECGITGLIEHYVNKRTGQYTAVVWYLSEIVSDTDEILNPVLDVKEAA